MLLQLPVILKPHPGGLVSDPDQLIIIKLPVLGPFGRFLQWRGASIAPVGKITPKLVQFFPFDKDASTYTVSMLLRQVKQAFLTKTLSYTLGKV